MTQIAEKIPYDQAYRMAGVAMPKLSEQGRKELADQATRNATIYEKLCTAVSNRRVRDVSESMGDVRHYYEEAEAALRRAWTPEEPEQFMAPAEARGLAVRKGLDRILEGFTSRRTAPDYEEALMGGVRQRYQAHIQERLEEGVERLNKAYTTIDEVRNETEDLLASHARDVYAHREIIDVAEARLEELPVQMEGRRGELHVALRTGEHYEQCRDELRRLRVDMREYERARSRAANIINIREKQIRAEERRLGQLDPLLDAVQLFEGNLDSLKRTIDLHIDGGLGDVDPQSFRELHELYERVKDISGNLEQSYEASLNALSIAVDEDAQEFVEQRDVQRSTREERVARAKRFADELDREL